MNEGRGFFLLPGFADFARAGELADHRKMPDAWLSIFVVLIAHENAKTRQCFPSLARLAALAGIGKANALAAIGRLEKDGWFTISLRPGHRCRCQNVYSMAYAPYEPGKSDSRQWTRVDRALVFSGLWGSLPPSARRLFIALRGFGGFQGFADGAYLPSDNVADALDATSCFVAARHLEPSFLAEVTGLPPRTLHRARCALVDAGLLEATTGPNPGVFLAFGPSDGVVPSVQAQAADDDEPVSRYATRALRALANRPRQNSLAPNRPRQNSQSAIPEPQIGHPRPSNRPLQAFESATREPEQVLNNRLTIANERGPRRKRREPDAQQAQTSNAPGEVEL